MHSDSDQVGKQPTSSVKASGFNHEDDEVPLRSICRTIAGVSVSPQDYPKRVTATIPAQGRHSSTLKEAMMDKPPCCEDF